MSSESPVLECNSLSKSYGPVKALREVSMRLDAGEVRALLGKNGAGKSTLVNILSGSQRPDQGTMALGGKDVVWSGPGQARAGGIAVVHQELSLVPGLSVMENIMLGRWPRRPGSGFIDAVALERVAQGAVDRLGEPLPLRREAGRLSLAQQQLVEIAKALVDEPRVLILDEPTSALHAHEVDALLGLVRRLAEGGVAVVYVSHRMNEIPRVADTLTVLRDGWEVETLGVEAASAERVAALIAGEDRTATTAHAADRRTPGECVLSVRDLKIPGLLDGVSLDLHQNEVLGIAGLLGSGRTELLEAVYGVRHDATGSVCVKGEPVRRRRPRRMLARGVGMTSEDRKGSGIVSLLGVGENIVMTARGRVLPSVRIQAQQEADLAQHEVDRLSIAVSSLTQEVGTLSGGNQQKVVIARLLAAEMSVLLLDEPTRGIDVHAKTQIYRLVRELASSGVSSIFVSSELDEVALVCDRVLVLRHGRIAEELPGESATAERLLALSMKEESEDVSDHDG